MAKKHHHGVDGEVHYKEHPGPFHGSPKETHTHGSGSHLGAYKTKTLSVGAHPGRSVDHIKTDLAGGKFQGGENSYKPKKISMKTRGQEED